MFVYRSSLTGTINVPAAAINHRFIAPRFVSVGTMFSSLDAVPLSVIVLYAQGVYKRYVTRSTLIALAVKKAAGWLYRSSELLSFSSSFIHFYLFIVSA